MRAFSAALKAQWAINSFVDESGQLQAPELDQILAIAQRAHEPNWEAVALKQAERVDQAEILQMRGDIAIVNIIGPIFRYANLFTEFSGATSIEALASRVSAAIEDPKVRAIVLNIDSPGGEVSGTATLAEEIYRARDKKRIVSYVDDYAASGGYWLASAASEIVVATTAKLGSIGTVATVRVLPPRDGSKTYEFVSSVSPQKRPNLDTDEGRSQIQAMIDDLGNIFVDTVARNRDVAREKVLSDFGQGFVVIASKAVAAGMADEIGTFEGLISSLEAEKSKLFTTGGFSAQSTKGDLQMDKEKATGAGADPAEKKQETVNLDAIRAEAKAEGKSEGIAEGVKLERVRIGAILSCDEATGREQLARTIAIETDTNPEAAKKLLASAPKQSTAPANPLAAAMTQVHNPKVGTDPANTDLSNEQAVAATLALYQGGKKEAA